MGGHSPIIIDKLDAAMAEIERLRRLLQWSEARLPEQYRAGLRRMIENPAEPDYTPIVHS
jgi:hypothetical protein